MLRDFPFDIDHPQCRINTAIVMIATTTATAPGFTSIRTHHQSTADIRVVIIIIIIITGMTIVLLFQ